MTNHFEAKLHGFRRTQDGVVISYVIHPNDVRAELATAALGTRYMIGFAELGETDEPVPVAQPIEHSVPDRKAAGSIPAGATKERKPFHTLPLSQQAAMRCQDTDFQWFMCTKVRVEEADDIAVHVRKLCGVASRSDLIKNTPAGDKWETLEREYQSWLTTKNYAESVR